MKKILFSIVILSILGMMLFSLSGCYNIHNNFEYEEVNGEIIIKHYNDTSTALTVTIPDEINGKPVVKIDNFGIVDSAYLETLYIGKNIREIASMGLKNHENLKNIFVVEGNQHFKSDNGVLYTANGEELVNYPLKNRAVQKEDKTWYIPPYQIKEGTKIIRDYAFYHVNGIEEIKMPDTVETIGNYAFMINDKSLTKINLSKNLKTIGVDAFSLNKGLTELTIYDKIEKIGSNAFYNCTNLLTINICKSASAINLGDKWYPTDLGRKIKDLKLNFDFQI